MVTEEIRARLVERADLLGNQEELEVIIEELKKPLDRKVNFFEKLDSEYTLYIQNRRSYYGSARDQLDFRADDSCIEASNKKSIRSHEFVVQYDPEADLRRLHLDFSTMAESLLEHMEAEDEEAFQFFGDYLEAQEKLRALDEKMFKNILKVNQELIPKYEDVARQVLDTKTDLEEKNKIMLQLVEKQDRLVSESEESRCAEDSNRSNASDFKDYLFEREQLTSDLDTFSRQKEALLKRKSCLNDELARLQQRKKLLEVFGKLQQMKTHLQQLERELKSLELHKMKLETDIVNTSCDRSERMMSELNESKRNKSSGLSSKYIARYGKHQVAEHASPAPKDSHNTFNSFLECLSKNDARPDEHISILSHLQRYSEVNYLDKPDPRRLTTSQNKDSPSHSEVISDISMNFLGNKDHSRPRRKPQDHSLNQFSQFNIGTNSSKILDRSSQESRPSSASKHNLIFTKQLAKKESGASGLSNPEEEYNSFMSLKQSKALLSKQASSRATPERSKDLGLAKLSRLWERTGEPDPKHPSVFENKRVQEASHDTSLSKDRLNHSVSGFRSDKRLREDPAFKLPPQKLDQINTSVEQKENDTSRFKNGGSDSASKTKRKHIQSLLNQMSMNDFKKSKVKNVSATEIKLDTSKSSSRNINRNHSTVLRDFADPQPRATHEASVQIGTFLRDQKLNDTLKSHTLHTSTSPIRSAASLANKLGSASDFSVRMNHCFPIFKRKQPALGKAFPTFSPFNANSLTPSMCGYEDFEALYEAGTLTFLVLAADPAQRPACASNERHREARPGRREQSLHPLDHARLLAQKADRYYRSEQATSDSSTSTTRSPSSSAALADPRASKSS